MKLDVLALMNRWERKQTDSTSHKHRYNGVALVVITKQSSWPKLMGEDVLTDKRWWWLWQGHEKTETFAGAGAGMLAVAIISMKSPRRHRSVANSLLIEVKLAKWIKASCRWPHDPLKTIKMEIEICYFQTNSLRSLIQAIKRGKPRR